MVSPFPAKIPFSCSNNSYLNTSVIQHREQLYSKTHVRNELPHETAVWPNDRPLRVNESKRSPQTHTAAAHEHSQQHCGAPADPSGAVKAYGFALRKEGSAIFANLVKVGGCLMECGFFRDRVKL
jgi:hypothetical protein